MTIGKTGQQDAENGFEFDGDEDEVKAVTEGEIAAVDFGDSQAISSGDSRKN